MALDIVTSKPAAKAIAITSAGTLVYVASKQTKRIPKDAMAAFGRFLRHWIVERYEDNQSLAGKALGITQGHISGMLNGVKGPGLNTLLLLRLETGKSIDEMLGFPAMPQTELLSQLLKTVDLDVMRFKKEAAEAREEAARLREELRQLKTASSAPKKRVTK